MATDSPTAFSPAKWITASKLRVFPRGFPFRDLSIIISSTKRSSLQSRKVDHRVKAAHNSGVFISLFLLQAKEAGGRAAGAEEKAPACGWRQELLAPRAAKNTAERPKSGHRSARLRLAQKSQVRQKSGQKSACLRLAEKTASSASASQMSTCRTFRRHLGSRLLIIGVKKPSRMSQGKVNPREKGREKRRRENANARKRPRTGESRLGRK